MGGVKGNFLMGLDYLDNNGARHDWAVKEIEALFQLPFNDLLFKAHTVHREHHDPNAVQISTLLSIKTGTMVTLKAIW